MRFLKIDNPNQLDERLSHFNAFLREWWPWEKGSVKIEWKLYTDPRTLSQNALSWMWYEDMAQHFSTKGSTYSAQQMHDLMAHQFLGYQDIVIGNTVIEKQLRGTSKLDKGEFHEFLEKVDAWACDHGIQLRYPDMSVYAEMKEVA